VASFSPGSCSLQPSWCELAQLCAGADHSGWGAGELAAHDCGGQCAQAHQIDKRQLAELDGDRSPVLRGGDDSA
jgi:hypothetical protein